MRSGQYKLSGDPNTSDDDFNLGRFKTNANVTTSEFPHLNSLVVTASRFNDANSTNSTLKSKRSFMEKANKDHKKTIKVMNEASSISNDSTKDGVLGAKQALNRVEQKVRILLQQGEAKLKADTSSIRASPSPPVNNKFPNEDVWQYGNIVTLTRKSKHNSMALSHSALNTMNTSDTVSCSSASSGYSSTSSSSYGSFKSSASLCSKLPLHQEEPNSSPDCQFQKSGGMTLVDNPLYDITPAHSRASLVSLSGDIPQINPLTRPTYKTLSTSEGSSLANLHENQGLHDPVARRCREYFEQRLVNSESLCQRWSIYSSDSTAELGDTDTQLSSMSTNPSSITSTSSTGSIAAQTTNTKKTPLDEKMDFLRKEIADLVHQDNALFHQLLTLHNSINALKNDHQTIRPLSPSSLESFTEDEEEAEEEEEEDDVQVEELEFGIAIDNDGNGNFDKSNGNNLKINEENSNIDSGREMLQRKSSHPCDGIQDAYVPPNSYVTSEPFFSGDQLLDNSTPKKQITNNNQNQNNDTRKSEPIAQDQSYLFSDESSFRGNFDGLSHYNSHHLYENSIINPTVHHEHSSSLDSSYKSDEYSKSDCYTISDIDEGLFTDMSLSHSTSPASTLSKASTSSSCSSRGHQNDFITSSLNHPPENSFTRNYNSGNLFFSRARKSYAPTARNRQRSSSAHQSPAPITETPHKPINTKTNTPEQIRPRAHSSGPHKISLMHTTISNVSTDNTPTNNRNLNNNNNINNNNNKSLTHSCSMSVGTKKSKMNIIKLSRSNTKQIGPAKSISVPISSSGTISMHSSPARRSNTVHPPYREVLIM